LNHAAYEDLPEPVDLVFDDEEESTVPVDPVAGFEAAQEHFDPSFTVQRSYENPALAGQ